MMGLKMEVAEHGVGFPPTQQFDFIANNVLIQQGGSAGSTEGFCRYIGRRERGGRQSNNSLPEQVGDDCSR